ncbi:MAG TPA: LysE family translocator [Roseomonas sp.]|jgi:threonine/homoserine/homoserine lactone efflux protein
MDQQAASWAGIWALVLTSAALMGSPGPSTMSVAAVGAAFGLRRSLGYALGLILGTGAVLLAVATGVFAMLLSIPRLAPVLATLSAAYILYLAIQIARAPPLPQQDPAAPAPSLLGGLLLAVANPKAYVAIAAVFASSRLEGLLPATEALIETAVLAVMIVLIHIGWLLAGASLSRVLRDPWASRIVNLALAGILVATTAAAAGRWRSGDVSEPGGPGRVERPYDPLH